MTRLSVRSRYEARASPSQAHPVERNEKGSSPTHRAAGGSRKIYRVLITELKVNSQLRWF